MKPKIRLDGRTIRRNQEKNLLRKLKKSFSSQWKYLKSMMRREHTRLSLADQIYMIAELAGVLDQILEKEISK